MFLLLFSYTMLFKFKYVSNSGINEKNTTKNNETDEQSDITIGKSIISWQEIILFIWIFTLSIEEIRQVSH